MTVRKARIRRLSVATERKLQERIAVLYGRALERWNRKAVFR
jgi:hypothetical protein